MPIQLQEIRVTSTKDAPVEPMHTESNNNSDLHLYKVMASENARVAEENQQLKKKNAELQKLLDELKDERVQYAEKIYQLGAANYQLQHEVDKLKKHAVIFGPDEVVTTDNPVFEHAMKRIHSLEQRNRKLKEDLIYITYVQKMGAGITPHMAQLEAEAKAQKVQISNQKNEITKLKGLVRLMYEAIQAFRHIAAREGRVDGAKCQWIDANFIDRITRYIAQEEIDLSES